MLKTISAALLAASVIAAPAFAAEAGKTDTSKTATQTPVIKADQTQTKISTTAVKPDVKSNAKVDAKVDAKADTKAMNANASISPDEHHKSVRTHRHHGKLVSAKKKTQPELGTGTVKTTPSTDKRS